MELWFQLRTKFRVLSSALHHLPGSPGTGQGCQGCGRLRRDGVVNSQEQQKDQEGYHWKFTTGLANWGPWGSSQVIGDPYFGFHPCVGTMEQGHHPTCKSGHNFPCCKCFTASHSQPPNLTYWASVTPLPSSPSSVLKHCTFLIPLDWARLTQGAVSWLAHAVPSTRHALPSTPHLLLYLHQYSGSCSMCAKKHFFKAISQGWQVWTENDDDSDNEINTYWMPSLCLTLVCVHCIVTHSILMTILAGKVPLFHS